MILVAMGVMIPTGINMRRDQKALAARNAKQQTLIDELMAQQQDKLSLKAAEQLREQLQSQLDRNHDLIMTLEADVAVKDKQIISLRGQVESMRGEIAALKEQNNRYQRKLERYKAQLLRHEIAPDEGE